MLCLSTITLCVNVKVVYASVAYTLLTLLVCDVLHTVSSMPFKSSKRAKNKEYYKLHATDLKESAKKKYGLDREHFIHKSLQHNGSAASVNVARMRKSVAKRVREHHSRNLDTSRASIKGRVSKHRQLCPDKSKADSKRHVSMHRQRNVQKAKKALVGMCLDFGRGIHSRQE